MIITIDTGKDTEEDIRKAIAFLSSLVQDAQPIPEPQPDTADVMAQLFDAVPQPVQQPEQQQHEDEYVELPKVQPYQW